MAFGVCSFNSANIDHSKSFARVPNCILSTRKAIRGCWNIRRCVRIRSMRIWCRS